MAARISQLCFEYVLMRGGVYRKVWNNIANTSETVEFVVGVFGVINYLQVSYLIESLVVERVNHSLNLRSWPRQDYRLEGKQL